jgi:plastocyanin
VSVLLPVVGASADPTTVKGAITFQGVALPADMPPADAVVILHGATQQPPPGEPSTIDQRARRFIPRVVVVSPGTTVHFPNHDMTHHNVHSRSSAHRFDLGLYPPGETRSTTFETPGMVEIRCTAHNDMEAYVVVSDSPYFAAVSGEGTYRIEGVAPGTYDAEIWHPDAVTLRTPLTVRPDIPVLTIDFDLRERRRDR